MKTALRYEIAENITELKDAIYPTNAPEGATKPYLVYARISTTKIKTFSGYENLQALSYMFSVMAVRYEDMVSLRDQLEDLLLAMAKTVIGKNQDVFIQDVDIGNITEQYEHELGVNRGIIDFTIYC